MAGAGAKKFPAFSKLASNDVNNYLMDQTIMRFATTAARDAAFGGVGEPTLAEGMTCYIDADNTIYTYDGSNWVKMVSTSDRESIGLWRVGGGAITGTSVSIENCFTSAYQNYKVIIRPTTLGADLRMRLRNAGGNDISANYFWVSPRIDQTGATSNSAGNAQDYFLAVIANASLADFCSVDLTFFAPQLNLRTVANGDSTWNNSSGFTGGSLNYLHNTAFQATGFTLYTSNGSSFSAVVDVYGLKGA